MHNKKMMYRFMQQENGTTVIYIYDDITAVGSFNWETWQYDESETSANHFVKLLDEVPDGGNIELHINSYGGEVKEGVAIYNLLKKKNATKVCYVDGFAYSVASVICMACDKVIMGLGTSMLIHNMWTVACGNADELRKEADDLDVLMEANRKIYLAKAKNITEQQLIDMMAAETILTPEKCVEYGFADEVSETVVTDQQTLAQFNTKKVLQLQRDIRNRDSLQQFAREFIKNGMKQQQNNEQPEGDPEDGAQKQLKPIQQKALKMMSAFFDANCK